MTNLKRKFIIKSYLIQILISFIIGVAIIWLYNLVLIRPAPKIRLILFSIGLGAIFSLLSGVLNSPNLLMIKKSRFKNFWIPILIFLMILILSYFIAKYYVDSSILMFVVPFTFINIIYNLLMILILRKKTNYNTM